MDGRGGEQARTVLVVDDESRMRRLLELLLAEEPGLRVLMAADGVEALSTVHDERVDLVVLDRVMPRMDGLHVCRSLKALPPEQRPRVLMFSAQATEYDRATGLAAGADAYLGKPATLPMLLAEVRRLLAIAPAQ